MTVNQPTRNDKYWHIGSLIIHYIHYYPQKWSVSQWGFAAWKFKGQNIDFYFGKHVVVFNFRLNKWNY